MPNRLESLKKENRLADIGDRLASLGELTEPGEVATTPKKESKVWAKGETVTKPAKYVGKKALGAVSWPYERASALVGTPYRELLKQRMKAKERHDKGEIQTVEKDIAELAGTLYKGLKPPVKSLVKRELDPEAVTIPQVVSEDVMPEAPWWAKFLVGQGVDFAVSPFLVGKALKGVGAAAKATGVPQKIKARSLPEWQRMKLRARMKTGARIERAGEVAEPLSGKAVKTAAKELSKKTGKKIHPKAVKERLGQIMKGGVTEQPQLQKLTAPAIKEIERTSKELKALGILPKQTYITRLSKKQISDLLKKKSVLEKQLTRLQTAPHYVGTKEISASFPGKAGKIKALQSQIDDITKQIQTSYKHGGEKYLPRMYASKEAVASKSPVYSSQRVRAPYAKQRQDIPFEIRKKMMEIQEPAYPVAKRLMQEGADIETAKLFEQAASKPEWVSKAWKPGLKKAKLPDSKGYGALKGMYVHPKIYDDVTELVRIKGGFEQLYDTVIGSWKLGKVVLSPATQFRNKISNKILLDLSGMGYVEQAKYAARALKEYRKNSKEYQVAKRYFARTTMLKGELLDDVLKTTTNAKGKGFERALNSIRGAGKAVLNKPSEIYQHNEFVNKFMKYLQQRDMGKSVIESVEEANKWLFDYGELSRWEKLIARRAMPFYTFPRKALPRVVEAMAERPHTIAKYPLMAQLTTQYSLNKLEMTDRDYEKLYETLPEYMQTGSYILMPYRDDNGDLRFFDWTYILPWGEVAEVQNRGILNSVVTNPLVQIVGDIQRNKKAFDGRPIWNETDLESEKTWKKAEYVWRNLAPSLAYKGIYWDKLAESASGKPSKHGKTSPLPETIAHTIFGLRTQAIDPKKQKMYNMFEKQEAIKELSSKLADITQRKKSGNITEEEYKKKRDQYLKQMKEVFK